MLESRAHGGGPCARRRGRPFGKSLVSRVAIGGAVAQLGERRVRNAKVEGSIPFRSISKSRT